MRFPHGGLQSPLHLSAGRQCIDERPEVGGAGAHISFGSDGGGVPEQALHLERRRPRLVQAGGEGVTQRVHGNTIAASYPSLPVDVFDDAGQLVGG